MNSYEATRVVFSRIQNLDPENASKIMGLLLIQDHGEKEMIRLAFGPESVVHSVIYKARKDLGLPSNSSTTNSTTPTLSSPLSFDSSSILFSRHNSSSSSASSTRLFNGVSVNLPSTLSIPNPSSLSCSWATSSNLSEFNHTPDDLISPNPLNSAAPPFYGKGELETDLIDEFQLQDQLSFLNDVPISPDFYGNSGGWDGAVNGPHHGRSRSVSDICYNSDDPNGGFGWKPCLYFARGYCKNGSSCRFLHGGISDSDGASVMNGWPSKVEMMEQCHELMRSKSAQQQRLAAASQLMGASNFPYSPSKSMNFLLQQQNDSPRAAAALMLGDEMNKFARSPGLERSEFSLLNPGSRQIYLTFPAESTFREEDVSNYFSIFGPVQDVRIPYQQKRMFGFVTFVYADTVKLILAEGNPHFVCDARVLVKPYKEKGKVPDKFRKQQMERGEFPACGSPTGLDSRDPFDIQLGARMLYNNEDILWRRKLEEQADLRQAIELQNRRLMGLQLLDIKRSNHHRALSTGAAISSPTHSPSFFHRSVVHSTSERSSPEFPEENGSVSAWANKTVKINQQIANENEKERDSSTLIDQNTNGRASPQHSNDSTDLLESLELNLPDNLFASPKSADAEENGSVFSVPSSANNNLMASTLDMASLTSCYFQAPSKKQKKLRRRPADYNADLVPKRENGGGVSSSQEEG